MTYASEVLADSPVLYLKLDETSGAVATDSSGNGRNGTHSGVTLNQASLLGSGVGKSAFYGGSGYTTFAADYNAAWQNTERITVEARIKPTAASLSGDQFIGSHWSGNAHNNRWLFYVSGGKLTANIMVNAVAAANVLNGTTTLVAGQTYTATMTYDGTTLRLYLNGVLEGSKAVSGILTHQGSLSPFPIELGRAALAAYGTIGIDEFSIMGDALSAARITARHTAAIDNAPPAPAQIEAVYAEVLTAGSPKAQIEALFAEALATGSPQAQVEAIFAEVLVTIVPPVSNVFDFSGVEREVYQWNGSELVPVSWGIN